MVANDWSDRCRVPEMPVSCLAEENQRLLLLRPEMGGLLPSLLTSRVLGLRKQSLALLLQLARTDHGRSLVVSHLDLTR